MPNPVMRYPWNTIMKISLITFVTSFSLYAALAFYYFRTLESFPNAASGSIFPLNIHGWVVYLDQPKHSLLGVLEAIQIICAAIFAVTRIVTLRRQS